MSVITHMSKRNAERWEVPAEFGQCVCSQMRRATRRVSSVYDKALAAAGLTVTQHALLVNIARAGAIGRSALAGQLGMERTTLTRNLRPLEREELVMAADSSDGRERLLCLSAEGKKKLRRSYVLWEETQKELVMSLGVGALGKLRAALKAAEAAAISL